MTMNRHRSILASLASLLDYPDHDYEGRMNGALSLAGQSASEPDAPRDSGTLLDALTRFVGAMQSLAAGEREELYTATFDITPACVLYVGVHLFGEDNSKRARFMAALQARYRESGFHAAGELADHLAVILRYAAATAEVECRELAAYCLLGALEKMLGALDRTNPYRSLMEAVYAALKAACPGVQPIVVLHDQTQNRARNCLSFNTRCACTGLTQPPPSAEDACSPPLPHTLVASPGQMVGP